MVKQAKKNAGTIQTSWAFRLFVALPKPPSSRYVLLPCLHLPCPACTCPAYLPFGRSLLPHAPSMPALEALWTKQEEEERVAAREQRKLEKLWAKQEKEAEEYAAKVKADKAGGKAAKTGAGAGAGGWMAARLKGKLGGNGNSARKRGGAKR